MIVSAFLLPLLYMVTTALQDAGQRIDRRARRSTRRARAHGRVPGRDLRDLQRPDRRHDRRPDAGQEGPRVESTSSTRPTRRQTPIVWQGALADARRSRGGSIRSVATSRRSGRSSTSRGCCSTPRPIAVLSTLGAVLSSALVAYGFARFRFPGKNILFIILIATIILPFQVTLIPTYAVFTKLGWNGTWLPLIVPHFFANAFNVFLLRQYFLSIPRDLDEAAMIDGASPFRVLRSVILPLSVPALVGGQPVPLLLLLERLLPAAPLPLRQARAADPPDRDPAVQRALLHAAQPHPDVGAHDHGHSRRRVLPGPARVHARRGRHRGREVAWAPQGSRRSPGGDRSDSPAPT